MRSLLCLLFPFLALSQPAAAADQPAGTSRVEFFGYRDCIRLENALTRVTLGHQAGGRVLEYALNGVNVIYLDPAAAGAPPSDGGQNMTGGRFDIGPEHTAPRRPLLWSGAWDAAITGPRQATLTSQPDPSTGVQLIRTFTLHEMTSTLTCTQTIQNVSDTTQEYCHWSRTFAVGNGIAVVPLSESSRFPNHYVMGEGRGLLHFRPEDPNIRQRDRFLEVVGPPKFAKLGMDSSEGWLAYAAPNDLLFVKRWDVDRHAVYSEVAGLTLSVWYPATPMVELEPIGPRMTLAPGEQASFTETWQLATFDFPKKDRTIDQEKLRATARGLAAADLFAPDNLTAWCIVPFDASQRGPQARAEMLNRLQFRSLAYDYRNEHIPQFDEEIATLKSHGIDLSAWWCGGVDPHNPVSGSVTLALDALRKNQDSADLWVMFNEGPLAKLDQRQRVKLIARAMDQIALAVSEVNGKVGIYNHGGWCGDPANQLAVARASHQPNAGVVFNFHHAHEHFEKLPALLKELRPHLLCINLNGMTIGGPKILPIGSGQQDREMLNMVLDSGYMGPIGILDHRPELDAEQSLRENLEGLHRLLR